MWSHKFMTYPGQGKDHLFSAADNKIEFFEGKLTPMWLNPKSKMAAMPLVFKS